MKDTDTVEYELKEFTTVREAVKASSRVDRKRAKEIFVERFSERLFAKHIEPILEQGGVLAIFTTKPTNFTRYYVDQIAAITDVRIHKMREIEREAEGDKLEAAALDELSRLANAVEMLDEPNVPLVRRIVEKPANDDRNFDVKLVEDKKEDYGPES